MTRQPSDEGPRVSQRRPSRGQFFKWPSPRHQWGDTDGLLKHAATSFRLRIFTQRGETGTLLL